MMQYLSRCTVFTSRNVALTMIFLVSSNVIAVSPAAAQQGQEAFADDFTFNSIRYSANSFSEVPGSGSAEVVGDQLILKARQGDFPDYGNIFIGTQEQTDLLQITAAFNPATNLPSGEFNENATLALEQGIYNTIADGGLGDGSNVGDVQARFDIRLRADGSSENIFCLGEQTADSFLPVNVFDSNTNNCASIPDITIATDVEYSFGFIFNRVSKELTFSLDGKSRSVTLPGAAYATANSFAGFQLIHQGEQGSVEARVRSITTDSGTDVIMAGSSIGRYQDIYSDDNRSAVHDGERIQLRARATEQGNNSIQLRVAKPTDYLEAVVEISSLSDLGERGRQYAELRADLYNDTANGGFNGREGEVTAFITFAQDTSGLRRIEYCLRRSDDADDNQRTGLLAEGRRCNTVPIRLELDTPYRVAVGLDREQSNVTFRVNGFSYTQTVTTAMFETPRKSMEIGASAHDLASVVATVDDLRTAPDVPTATELESGLSTSAAFPPALDQDALVADKTLTTPVFDDEQILDFVDDFSTPTMNYGFWDGRERGEVSVSASPEGYVEFQVNSEDTEQGNYAEFYVNEQTDMLSARMSLSSLTRLPQDSDAQAAARIQGTFYNDTANGGTDQTLGDVYISLQMRARGDGRRDASLYMERRAADGSRDSQMDLIAEGENVFDDFVPEFDTEYTLTLELDRENRVLKASIDDVVLEVAIPTEIFTAARPDKQVQISHYGASGRAVGRIHMIKTEQSSVDFAIDSPVIGPYRPAFNARYAGVEVSHEDGRVRMVADSALSPDRGADLQARGVSDYLAATMLMSSETTAVGEGAAYVGIGGLFYNDLRDGGEDGATGSVFATVALGMETAASGESEVYVEYCAFRSSDANFNESVELIGGDDENCPRFSTPGMTDVAYEMSIQLDRVRNVLQYRLGDELHEYAISTPVYKPHSRFNGARARARDGARAVGYADNLSYAPMPVALADSPNRLGPKVVESAPSGSGGGGCSISGGGNDPLLPGMALISLLIWVRRRLVV